MIQISQLAKKYRGSDQYTIEGLDLSVGEGEIFGLLGPNGAGKTTLISMLSLLLEPTSGTFSIAGLDSRTQRRKLQQLIGVVPQEYALYPSLTAFENLCYFGSMYGLKGPGLKAEIARQFELLGLTSHAASRVATFSGGMKRRLNLIAGILHRPKVLFLDEPTVGVDVQSRQRILLQLGQLNADGTTIFYTSHLLNEAESFCSNIAILDHGKIISRGRPADLISSQPGARHLEDVFISLTGSTLRDHA